MKAKVCLLFFSIMVSTAFAQDTTYKQSQYATIIDETTASKGSWIGINGTVAMAGANSFFLDHGDSTVIVGLAGEDLRETQFVKGQRLIVFGKLDKDFFERNILKARAVRTFSDTVSEGAMIGSGSIERLTIPQDGNSMIYGLVSAVTETRVIIDEGDDKITIDSSEIGSTIKNANGTMRVKQGDVVEVHGKLSREFWNDQTFKATTINVVEGAADGSEDMDDGDRKAGLDRDED